MRLGVRVEQENMSADGFGHFDPAAEYAQFQKGYVECLAGGQNPDRCARANLHYFHKYERFPVTGTFPFRPNLEDQTVGLQPRIPEQFRTSNTNIGPRLSVSWDPGTNGKLKLFGTAGRYYGETFLLIPLYEQPPDPFTLAYRVIADESTTQCRPDRNGDGTPECVTYPLIDSDQNSRVSPASIRQVDRDLRALPGRVHGGVLRRDLPGDLDHSHGDPAQVQGPVSGHRHQSLRTRRRDNGHGRLHG